jgi:hypothetical protein
MKSLNTVRTDMAISERGATAGRKRPLGAAFIVPLLFGLIGLFRVMGRPQFESYRTMDVVQLVLSGACFGAALVLFMVALLRPHH